jgi:hypothetical protein
MLTNFVTIKKRIGLLDQLEARQLAGDFDRLPKKEAALLTEELNKLNAMLGGIRKMKRLPGAIFIVDPHRERIAVTEANKLEIPVIGTGDTNVDPDELDFIIPANDDAIRAIRLLCQLVADAAIEGAGQRAARAASEPEAPESAAIEEPEFDETAAADLVAQLAAGGTLSFDPDLDDDDLLPGSARPATDAAAATNGGSTPAEATPAEVTTAKATPADVAPAKATPAEAATTEATSAEAATADEAPAAATAKAKATKAESPAAEETTSEATISDAATADESEPEGKSAG